ncbi:MAG: hypothetical protein AAF804_04645 [Bacteroidota bacterium]
MPRILAFFLLLLLFSPLASIQAQDITARLDLGRRDPKPFFYQYSPSDGGLVTLGPTSTVSSRYLGLVKYDRNLDEVWSKEVLEQNGRRNVDFVTIIGQYIMVFVSEFSPKERVIKTFYYSYDLEGNQIADQALLSVYPNQKEQKVELQYVLSPNKRRLLCYKNLENRRESEEILYYIFDDEGELVTNGELGIRYPDDQFRVRSLRVSNSGNIYVMGQFFITSRIRNPDDFRHVIFREDAYADEPFEIQVDIGNRFISNLAFRLDRDENIYIAGFYSNQREDQLAGTLFQKISPEGEVLIESAQPFTAQFLRNYLSSGQIDRGRELRNFQLDPENGIILRSDGGVLLLAEQFYITYQTYRDFQGMPVDRTIFHFDDVVLTSIDGEGQIEWQAIVEKRQQSEQAANLSFFNAIGPGGVFIFYEYRPRGGAFNIYYHQIDINGGVTGRRPLFKEYRYGNAYYPRYSEQISNDEAIMVYFNNKGRGLSVIKVRF